MSSKTKEKASLLEGNKKSVRQSILEKEFIEKDSEAYDLIKGLGLDIWVYECPKCDLCAVSTSQIGVRSRFWSHYEKQHTEGE